MTDIDELRERVSKAEAEARIARIEAERADKRIDGLLTLVNRLEARLEGIIDTHNLWDGS